MTHTPTLNEWEAAEKRLRAAVDLALKAYIEAAEEDRAAARIVYKQALERFTLLVVHGIFPKP